MMDTSNFKEVFESPKVKALTAQVAALEAEIVRLREALSYFVQFNSSEQSIEVFLDTCEITKARKALSTPFTPTALNELIEKVEKIWREKCAEYCAKTGWKMDYDEIPEGIRALPVGQIKLEELL